MSSSTHSRSSSPPAVRRRSLAGRVLLRALRRFEVGRLVVQMPSGERVELVSRTPGPDATVVLHRWRMTWRLMLSGDLGFAESYIDGDWSSPDLPALIEWAARNTSALGDGIRGLAVVRLANWLAHKWRGNSRRGSRRNIVAHYDLGNDFYAAWLDAGMTYSSAIYREAGQSLEQAQDEKLARVLQLLRLDGGERVLEIGCGWGALAERLVRDAGCHVVGVTLSPSQLAYARARMDAAGLAAHTDLRLQDYRDVQGRFDRIVSIEMLEAVGEAYWPVYFARLRESLAPGGIAVLQVISIEERRFEDYRRTPDFIQRHIFPGGMLPSVPALRDCIARAGLALESAEQFALSYAATLAEWRRRFHRAWPDLRAGAFDDAFGRKWDYYLAYCEAGFRAGAIDVGLYTVRHAAA
jgi:cyclopropane-fatty-acyl-phospholipid synthase